MGRKYLVKISNLRNCSKTDLSKHLVDLFTNHLNISIDDENIDIGQDTYLQYAVVYLKARGDMDKCLGILSSKTSTSNLNFNLKKLVYPECQLEVTRLKFYRIGDKIGMKDKIKEFKSGQGDYVDQHLKDDIIKHICGFLNCTGCGTLYIGVSHNGYIKGSQCDQLKMNIVTSITGEVFKTVQPFLKPEQLQMEFIPVYDSEGFPQQGLKIIEIKVNNTKPTCIYSVSDQVYIRQVTKVTGPLSVTNVLAMSCEMHRADMERERKEILKDAKVKYETLLENKRTEIQQSMNEKLRQETDKIQKERQMEINNLKQVVADIKSTKDKRESKTCILM